MTKRFGEWLPIFCAGFIVYLGVVSNVAVSSLGLLGSLGLAWRYGFDGPIVLGVSIFGFLFFVEFAHSFLVFGKQRYLKSVWPNAFEVFVRLAWIGFASFLLYSLFGADAFKDYPKGHVVLLCVAIALLVGNVPFLIFHASLCSKKIRDGFLVIAEDVENRMKTCGADAPSGAP